MLHSDEKCGSLEERFFQSVLQMNFPAFFSITQKGGGEGGINGKKDKTKIKKKKLMLIVTSHLKHN